MGAAKGDPAGAEVVIHVPACVLKNSPRLANTTPAESPVNVFDDQPVPPSAEFQPGVLMKLAAPLPAGDYRLRFSADGFAEQEASVCLVAGEVVRCAVRLASSR